MEQPGDTHSPEESPTPPAGEQVSSPDAESMPAPVAPHVEEQPQRLTLDQRKQLFASTIQTQVATGGRVESQDDFQAVVARSLHPNRVLHLILTLSTFFWLFVWLALELSYRPSRKRQIINVDEFGLVTIQPAEREMATAISNALDAPQVAGTFVSPKGLTKRTVIRQAGSELGGIFVFGWIGYAFVWVGKTIGGLLTDIALAIFPKRRARRRHEGEPSAVPSEATPPSLPPDTGGYVAISAHEVVIIQVHPGLRKVRIGPEVVGRVTRSAVASAGLERRRRLLRIGFVDGGWSEFEVARIHRDTAEQVVHALGGRVR